MVRQAHHERRKAAHPERVEGLLALRASAVSQGTKKPARPGDKSPERLALNSPFHIPLRRTFSVPPVWPHIILEAFSMVGEACYERTDITCRTVVKQV
jgi:hypothetical protein